MRSTDAFLFLPRADRCEDDVLGRDQAETLGYLLEQRRRQDQAAALELRAVTHWADLHRADLHRADGLGAVDPFVGPLAGTNPVLGREGELRLAGDGAFSVDEFAVAELAAALGMSEASARALVGQALELRDRLPRCYARVLAGDLPAWKARQIAAETIPLTGAAATYVDGHLAPFASRLSLGRILRAVQAAVIRHDPDVAAERARAAADRRGVWLTDELDGTTRIDALTGTPDAHAFDAALSDVAAALAALGDDDLDQVRRAKAIGILADPQYALDLVSTADMTADGEAVTPPKQAPGTRPTIHLHLHTAAASALGGAGLPAVCPDPPVEPVARVSGAGITAGARPVAAVEQWLSDLAPGTVVKVTPVVDLSEALSVDAYEIPDRLRAQVEHRDPVCVFPWCGRAGAFDVDHIEAYRFEGPDDPDKPYGRPPPGQTHSANLARLCRFHHRVKTHGGWSYRREHGTVVTWTSPLGRRYAVDENGTRPLSRC